MAHGRRSSPLVTVLFTDVVGSTEIAAELGDRRWRELLTRHHSIVRAALRRHGGREVDTAGDGVLSAFGQPEAAMRCALAIAGDVQVLGIDIRAGVHVGQAELIDGKVGGLVVHTGARIASLAGPAEVLVSRTFAELVPGTGFRFEDRGAHTLKGVPGDHHVLAVSEVRDLELPRPLAPEEAARRRREIQARALPRRLGPAIAGTAVALAAGLAFLLLRPAEEPTPEREAGLPPSTLVSIDPATNRIVATIERAPPLGGPGRQAPEASPDVSAGGGAVWVTSGGQLTHVDPQSDEVTRIPTTWRVTLSTVGHNAVWASTREADVIMRVDPATLSQSGTVDLGEAAAPLSGIFLRRPIGSSLDAVWVGENDELIRIDPVDAEITGRFHLDQTVDELDATARDVWVVDRLARSLARFSTEEGGIVETITLQTVPDAFAAEEDGDAWVANTETGTVTPVENGQPREAIRVGTRPIDIEVGRDAVWVADPEDETVTRIDPALGRVESVIDVGGPVRAITVDPTTGTVWAYVV